MKTYNRDNYGRFHDTKIWLKIIGIYVKRTLIVTGIISAIGWGYVFGTMTKLAAADTKIIMVVSTSTPAVMSRIEKCESGGSQYDKNGQVTIHVNTDGSYDIGLYQINSIWEKQATKLGYDLSKEKDNKAFATWLYENKGTGAWSSSSKCWQ